MEFEDQEMPVPTLTFGEPEAEETTAVAETRFEEPVPVMDPEETKLTTQEQQMVEQFSQTIDLNNSNAILQYGAGAQKKIADFSTSALESVKTKDLGEVGKLLANVVTELKSFDVEEEKGIKGWFKKSSNKLTSIRAQYAKAEVNVTEVSHALENHQVQLLKDVAMLDKMYELNLTYFKELSMYILAGKKKLEHTKNVEIPALTKKAQETGLQEDAQAANDLTALANRFEKKLHDLELTRMISLQMGPQIRLLQNNDTLMSEKIQSTLVNTIPLWRSQMVIAIGVAHSQEAAEATREATEMTNALLKKNAESLKMATIETAKESERGIVDIETLKATNQSLISTLDEVMKIQDEGRQKRAAAEVELQKMEQEMKEKLLTMKA
jgi:uncharacterized protein YaaN involved in tellurite resistance